MIKKLLLLFLFSLQLLGYERIIALSPAINEILYALESGDKIVGNTTYCTYPEDSKKKQKVGGYFSPNLEKILFLKPDMVIMQTSSIELSKQLNHFGIETKVITIDKLDSIKNAIKTIGEIVHKEQKAKEIITSIDISLTNLKGIIKDKKILIAIGHNLDLSKQIYVAGQNLYYDDIINMSGNTNALQSKRKGQPVLNLENIIHLNPDIVILISPFMKDKNLSKEVLIKPWKEIPINAAKTNSIFVEPNEYAGIPSHRLKYFIDDFRGFLLEAKNL